MGANLVFLCLFYLVVSLSIILFESRKSKLILVILLLATSSLSAIWMGGALKYFYIFFDLLFLILVSLFYLLSSNKNSLMLKYRFPYLFLSSIFFFVIVFFISKIDYGTILSEKILINDGYFVLVALIIFVIGSTKRGPFFK